MIKSSKFNQTDPYHIYYDMDIYNSNSNDEPPVNLQFTEIRSSNIVESAGDWFMSIIRLNMITGNSLPLMIPTVATGQPNPNKLIYSVTLTYKNYEYQQYLIYVPSDLSQPIPQAPLVQQDLTSEYYYIKNFTHFMSIVNKAYSDCYNGLKLLVQAGGDALPSIHAPFTEWDNTSSLSVIDADVQGYDLALTNPIKIWFNNSMFNLFNSFDTKFYGYSNIVNGKNYLVNMVSIGGSNILNLPTYSCLQVYQQTATAPTWNPVKSIVFVGTFPMNASLVSKPMIVSGSNLISSGNNNNIQQIITDIALDDLTLGTEYSQTLSYVASKYRLIDLFGNNGINNIQISVYWKNSRAEYIPFKIQSQASASIKLMFRRKDYNQA